MSNAAQTETKMSRKVNGQRDAARYQPGQRIWIDGHGPENLIVIVTTKVSRDADGEWFVDLTQRPATSDEYRETKMAWLAGEEKRLRSLQPDKYQPVDSYGTYERAIIAEYEAVKAEIGSI